MSVVNLPAGILPPYTFVSGNVYEGHPSGTIIQNQSTGSYQHTARIVGQSNFEVRNVTFDSNGWYLERLENAKFIDVVIQNARRTRDDHQGIYAQGLTNVLFERFAFKNCSHATMLYGCKGVTFRDSRVERSGYGIKIQAGEDTRDIVLDKVIASRIRASMGVEIQGDFKNTRGIYLVDCAYVDPELYEDDTRNKHSMAWSVPVAFAKDVKVTRCYASGDAILLDGNGKEVGRRKSSQSWRGVRIGHEVGGTGCLHEKNWIEYVNDPGAINGSGGSMTICRNNYVRGCVERFDYGSDAPSAGDDVRDNDDRQAIPLVGGWTMVGKTPPIVEGGTTPPIPPTPTPKPKVTVTVASAGEVDVEVIKK